MSESPNYLIVTHNTRMRCLLMAIFRNQIKLKSAREKDGNILLSMLEHKIKKIKFKNASVLKIEIENNKDQKEKCVKLLVSLFYEGELDEKEEMENGCDYWQNTSIENTSKCLSKNTFQPFECLIPTRLCLDYDFSQECNLYIVRHGQATHNVKGFFAKHLSRDTDLTDTGIQQARRAGKQLNHLLSSHNFKFSHFFSSDLKRTRQTFTNIVGQLDLNKINHTTNHTSNSKSLQLVVLPCAHEIEKLDENGQCDGFDKNLFHQMAKENKTACTLKDDNNIMSECSHLTTNNTTDPINVKIEWAYYRYFYGDKDGYKKGSERDSQDYTRNSFFKSKTRLRCKKYKLSIISSLFDYFRHLQFQEQKNSKLLAFTQIKEDSYNMPNKNDESPYENPYENDENPYENDENDENDKNPYENTFPEESVYVNARGGRKSQKRRRSKVSKRLRNRKTCKRRRHRH